jgi:hypothetical protein
MKSKALIVLLVLGLAMGAMLVLDLVCSSAQAALPETVVITSPGVNQGITLSTAGGASGTFDIEAVDGTASLVFYKFAPADRDSIVSRWPVTGFFPLYAGKPRTFNMDRSRPDSASVLPVTATTIESTF